MIVVGIDTSTKNLNIGICGEDFSMGKSYDTFRSNVEKIDYYLNLLLNEAGITLSDIDGFVVTNGPGSYSGLRVGAAFVKGCCFRRDIKFLSLSTVYVMAFHYREEKDRIAVVYDIKHDKVVLMDNVEFKETIVSNDNIDEIDWNAYKLTGNGIPYLKKHISLDESNILQNGIHEPVAEDVARAGYTALKSGKTEDIIYFEPRYFK